MSEVDPEQGDVLEPEEDLGLPRRRSEHGGMPLHPDDDALEVAVERDRVAAGIADYAPPTTCHQQLTRRQTMPPMWSTWRSGACSATPVPRHLE